MLKRLPLGLKALFLQTYKINIKKMRLNYNIEIREIADMYVGVAMDFETGEPQKTFRLNNTGVTIVKALQEGNDEEAIVAKILKEFTIDATTAKKETVAFIQLLADNGLLQK